MRSKVDVAWNRIILLPGGYNALESSDFIADDADVK